MNIIAQNAQEALTRCDDLYEQLRADFVEFAQGQTDFQMEVFIANGEGPVSRFPVHAYRHILAQVKPLISEIRRVSLDKMRLERRRARIDPMAQDADLDLMEIDYRLEELELDLIGKWSTYRTYSRLLTTIKDKYGPFTNEDLSNMESAYWEYRLSKQMLDSRTGASTGFGAGNLDSLRRALIGSPIDGSPHIITNRQIVDGNGAITLQELVNVVGNDNTPQTTIGMTK